MPERYVFRYHSHTALERDFFEMFPNAEHSVHKTDLGAKMGGTAEIIVYAGSALLSSATVAAALKAWVDGRRRKIVISIADKKLEYEGPNLPHDLEMIEGMIERLSTDTTSKEFTISAPSQPIE
jgi:hypothetical protein